MDNQPSPAARLMTKKVWLWVAGGLIVIVIGIVALTGKDEKSTIQTQTPTNTNSNSSVAPAVKTITIPSLAEYGDDQATDDAVQNIAQENVAIPAGYTVVSSGNLTITNPVGSEANVSSVVDGDTVKLSDGNKVRILGIDTPETVDPRKAVQCYGKEASAKMKELVLGKRVVLLVDASQGDKDKYGRLLRYIFIGNTDIGAEMIRGGYAFAYTAYPVAKMEEYKALEKDARDSNSGLWAATSCNGSTVLPAQATTQTNTNTAPVANTNTAVTTNTNTSTQTNTNTATNTNTSTNTNTTVNTNSTSTNTGTSSDCYCDSNRYNCTVSDFKTHAEAQALHDCCMQKVGSDIHGLDGNDNDGLACESLP